MAEITSEEEFRNWLSGKPNEAGILLASRAALRRVPDFYTPSASNELYLYGFFANAIAWTSVGGYDRDCAVARAYSSTLALDVAGHDYIAASQASTPTSAGDAVKAASNIVDAVNKK